jgi:hypothetical protein
MKATSAVIKLVRKNRTHGNATLSIDSSVAVRNKATRTMSCERVLSQSTCEQHVGRDGLSWCSSIKVTESSHRIPLDQL